ncbi:hypothetical protein G6L37_03135 [Agrobacterium rubi]|nr:hypothetical protein [Agrobacterium rubi]NTF24369.1 hypothetical protein [Agrobacterium rubi]
MATGMTVQVISNEPGKEDSVSYARLMVSNHKGRFHVTFKGAKAEHLTRDLIKTLGEGETISSKKLFVELFGEWTTFTRPNSTFKVRYFKAEDYKIVDGPSLELARMRGQATEALQSGEALRNAGAFGQAYKVLATYLAEIAQIPLDLSDVADADLIGEISDANDGYDPESAAAAHYARQDAAANERAAEEDATPVEPAPSSTEIDDLDDIVIAVPSEEALSEMEAESALEIDQDRSDAYGDADASDMSSDQIDNEDVPSDDDEQDNADEEEEVISEDEDQVAEQAPAPGRRFGFGSRRG